jgi:uncharacterized phage protein (TIGR02220 family)
MVLMEIDSLDGDGGCWASNEYLAKFCQCSVSKVSKAIAKLTDLGYVYRESFDGRKRMLRSAISHPVTGSLVKNDRQSGKKCQADWQNLPAYNIHSSLVDESTRGDVYSQDPPAPSTDEDEYRDIVVAIIGYLNEKTGSNRRPTSKENITLITALLKDGYTLDDFKKVIDTKCADWLGDREMSKYLRPSTLFAKKHFDDYLNQPASRPAPRKGRVTSGDNTDFRDYD